MVDPTFVESFYERHRDLYQALIRDGQISFAADFSVTFARSLVLAIASYFEHDVTDILRGLSVHYSNSNAVIGSIIERQVITRKYHTYFDWDALSAGPFLGLFGVELKALLNERIRADSTLTAAMKNFLVLGQTRNRLVHQNFVQFDVEQTPDELMQQFRSAQLFPRMVRECLFPSGSAYEESGNASASEA